MIQTIKTPTTETSDNLQSRLFGIADLGLVFDILRSKLYSNPILAVCREISCNARDAHREVGDFTTPISIHLPNSLEPEYRIKDFGPGISPDRVENIFTKYAASTKRNDNIQTGYWGLGSKSVFSVSDTAVVITIFNGIKYSYTCYIDQTNVGKMALLNKEKTSEPNGTEIIIPIKPQDFQSFKLHTEEACRHWDVKPNITGGTITWTSIKKAMSGKNWSINDVENHYYGDAKAIIDGIEYPLDLVALKKYADTKLITNCRGTLHLIFGIGELSLAANREQIYLDKPTQDKIRFRLEEISKEVVKLVEAKIDAMPNYWQANLYYKTQLKEAFSDLGFLGKISWQGTPLLNVNGQLVISCPVFTFSRRKYRSKLTKLMTEVIRREMTYSLAFNENSALFINDLDIENPTNKFVSKAFLDPDIQSVQLICPTDQMTEDELNHSYHVDLMGVKKISTITNYKKRTPRTAPTAYKMLAFKLMPTLERMAFRQISIDDVKKDTKQRVFCSLIREQVCSEVERYALLNGKDKLPMRTLESLGSLNPNVVFYGFDEDIEQDRINKQFPGCTKLDDFITKMLGTKEDYLEVKVARNNQSSYDANYNRIGSFDVSSGYGDWVKLIKNPKSQLLARALLAKRFKKLLDKIGMLELFESINGLIPETEVKHFLDKHPELNVLAMNKQCQERYPLLSFISHGYGEYSFDKHFADYINSIDN